MIKVKRLVRQIRMKNKDNNEVKFSDYDMLNAINECIRYLNTSLAEQNCDFLERSKHYDQNKMNEEIDEYNKTALTPKDNVDFMLTGVDFPDDFLSIVSIVRGRDGYVLSPIPTSGTLHSCNKYKVFGNKIYCDVRDFWLLYRGILTEITQDDMDSATATVDFPTNFMDGIVKLTGLILNQAETDVLLEETQRIVSNIVNLRRYSNVKTKMPFIV
jgi:hypothetical protein